VIIEFWDREGRSSTLDVTRKEELVKLFATFPGREPFFCQLLAENTYKLLVGIRGRLGCVQHSPSEGDPPYMVAVTPIEHDPHDEAEFVMENEVTPISARYALPIDLVEQIALYFLETGERSPDVIWEEI
jgi:hypothetical protein